MDIPSFSEQCILLGLERISPTIINAARPCIRINSMKKDDAEIAIDGSKLGGNPDVPHYFTWPRWEAKNLAFLVQINLVELAEVLPEPFLPRNGMLSFFYDSDQSAWGYDPGHRGSWQTYYFHDLTPLERWKTPPLHLHDGVINYDSCSLKFVPSVSYPNPSSDFFDEVEITGDEMDAYCDLYSKTIDLTPNHQMFCHANIIQNPMEIECQFVTQGIYLGDGKWINHPNLEQLKAGYKAWRLLLQLDSDENARMMWGDAGMLYFWIREEHLREKDFTQTWMMLQCG